MLLFLSKEKHICAGPFVGHNGEQIASFAPHKGGRNRASTRLQFRATLYDASTLF
jgi:hypothetical protein